MSDDTNGRQPDTSNHAVEQAKIIHDLRDEIKVLEAKNKALREVCKKLRQTKQ